MTDPAANGRATTSEAARRSEDEAGSRRQESARPRPVEDVIAAMHERAERVKRDELERAVTKLEGRGSLTAERREAIEAMADEIASDLLATPTASLRAAAANEERERIDAALDLFDPAGEIGATQTGDSSLFVEMDSEFGGTSTVRGAGDDAAQQ